MLGLTLIGEWEWDVRHIPRTDPDFTCFPEVERSSRNLIENN